MVVYLASGKSMHSSQVFSKQGGKGTRPILEKILTNSEDVCKFSAPEKAFLFYSYDNIQTLLKSYRIGGNHQKKVLAKKLSYEINIVFFSPRDDFQLVGKLQDRRIKWKNLRMSLVQVASFAVFWAPYAFHQAW